MMLLKERKGLTEEDRFFNVLTWARAMQIYDIAVEKLAKWAAQQSNPTPAMSVVQMLRERESIATIKRSDPSVKAAIREFKNLLRHEVREETYAEPGENADEIFDNEIDSLLNALGQRRSGSI